MNEPTLTQQLDAVEDSIHHWERDNRPYDKTKPNTSADACALCRLHHALRRKYDHDERCGICPLTRENKDGCFSPSSPYARANALRENWQSAAYAAAYETMLEALRAARGVLRDKTAVEAKTKAEAAEAKAKAEAAEQEELKRWISHRHEHYRGLYKGS